MASRFLAPMFLIAAAAVAAAPALATEIPNWPCKAPYKESLTAADVWTGTPPTADGDWHKDEGVRKLVEYVTNPENSPRVGSKAIHDFSATLGPDKPQKLALALAGMVDETNVLRSALIAGIRNLYARADILGDAVKEDDAMLAKTPADAAATRKEIQTARKENFRNKDDAEDETNFTCYRLGYVEKKLRLLTQDLQDELRAQN